MGARAQHLRNRDTAAGHAADEHLAVLELEVVRRGLQVLGGQLEQLPPRVAGGHGHGRAAAVDRLAAGGDRRLRRRRAVAQPDLEPFYGDAKGLGSNDRERRRRAADIRRSDLQVEAAVGLDPAVRAGRFGGADPGPGGHPHALARFGGLPEGGVVARRLQALDDAGPVGAVGLGSVAQAKLDGIDPQPFSELVERRFEHEVGLGTARCAIGVDRDFVGRHLEAPEGESSAHGRPG
jgi:hypothetical protein